MSTLNPCQHCGACCSAFRVTFYWAETDAAPGGQLPVHLTNSVGPTTRCMKGTDTYSPRCIALAGDVGDATHCRIYPQRPSPCREVSAGDAFCQKARARHGLPPLVPMPVTEPNGNHTVRMSANAPGDHDRHDTAFAQTSAGRKEHGERTA